MAATLTITAKGQITLRKGISRTLVRSLEIGSSSTDLLHGGIPPKRGQSAASIVGLLAGSVPKRLSIDEINEETATAWAGER